MCIKEDWWRVCGQWEEEMAARIKNRVKWYIRFNYHPAAFADDFYMNILFSGLVFISESSLNYFNNFRAVTFPLPFQTETTLVYTHISAMSTDWRTIFL